MDERIDQAIEKMVEMAKANQASDNALRFTQAALNLAHVKTLLRAEANERKTKGASAS